MNHKLIRFLCIFIFGISSAQWNPVSNSSKLRHEGNPQKLYTLDVPQLKAKLKNTAETGRNAKPVEILVPVLYGAMERFAVYSAPVVVPALAQRYDLGSYVGVGIDDPSKYIRFSLSGKKFQSMTIKNGNYEFIEAVDPLNSLFTVMPKSDKSATGKPFQCSVGESLVSRKQLDQLYAANRNASFNAVNFSASSDRKFRTLRLAISTTAEYTNYFGGVPQALAAINATLTTVNGILERDVSTRLILQDFPELIYTDPATDPYSNASTGVNGIWGTELMNTLHNIVGDDKFDIGHLFGATGGGGNSRCIGCICTNDKSLNSQGYPINYKGSAYTSPADGIPAGNTFDVDFVTHEIGHQLGATHTFTHSIEQGNNPAQMEPGSGSTVMSYAGISTADVQKKSDPYFHGFSISQIQNNLISKTCDSENAVTNTPPVISTMPDLTIPRSTAFVLKATATDAENNPLTYTWEQLDTATEAVTTTTGNNTTGPLFRSLPPSGSPTRYFPKLSLVMSGTLTSKEDWESVSHVARVTTYRITVRDNNPDKTQQQTGFSTQKINVGSDGPFKISAVAGENYYAGVANNLTWDVVKTNAAPYNVANVKITYTTDDGNTWSELAASTPNDGAESVVMPVALVGQNNLQFRIEALGNVFYAVSPKVNVVLPASCLATVPQNINIHDISYTGAAVSWDAIPAISSYIFEYRKTGEANYTVLNLKTNSVVLNNLESGKTYEIRIKSTCPALESAYTGNYEFTTSLQSNCSSSSTNGTNEYIQKVEIDRFLTSSGSSAYTDYSALSQNTIYLNKNTQSYSIRVTPKWMGDKTPVSVGAWIDFNGDGVYGATEQILAVGNTTDSEIVSSFSIPADAPVGGSGVMMRVSLKVGSGVPVSCGEFSFGEVEDYKVIFSDAQLFYQDRITAYPNPFMDYVYTTNVADGTGYKVYDMSGRIVKSGVVMLNKIHLSMLLPATYVLAVQGKEGIKIVKEAN